MVNLKRILGQSTLASLLFFTLGANVAFAASVYDVVQTTATVGTHVSLEIEYTVDTAQQTWADGDTLTLTLPDNFPQWSALTFTVENDGDANNDATNETAITAGAGNGQYATSVRTITVKWDVSTWGAPNNGAETIRFLITANNIPTYANAASSFAFGGATANGGDTNPSGSDTVNVSADPLASTNLTFYTYAQNQSTTHTVFLTTSIQIPSGGKISITYPSGFDLSSLGSTTAQRLSGMSGTWTASVAGQTVTYTQSGGSATSAGALSFEVVPVRNPSTTGTTSNYTITTKDSSGNSIETDTAVPGDTITEASSSITVGEPTNLEITDAEDGNGVVLTWTDPDDDTTTVQILRGIAPLPVDGTALTEVPVGTETYTDTDVEEGDVVTYQLRATSGSTYGDLTDEVTFTVGSSDDSTDDTTDGADTTDDEVDTEDDTTVDDETTGETDEVIEVDLNDIEGHWAETEITAMAEGGIVEGNPDGSFNPEGDLNRAEAAALLWRVLDMGDPDVAWADPFTDVDMEAWYAAYITELKDLSLVEGNPDGSYEPAESINRAEFLQLAMNVYLHVNEDLESTATQIMEGEMTDVYNDLDTAAWYAPVVTLATEWEFVQGSVCSEGRCFNAASSITRAEATVILYRMFSDAL